MDPKLLMIAAGVGLVVGFAVGRLSGRSSSSVEDEAEGDVAEGEGVELYVGNLSYDLSEKALMKVFSAHGSVLSARIIKNKFNNRSKGYGFIEMASSGGAKKAVAAMHGNEVDGRKLVVNEARSRSRDA
jgi:RNA recognition motif-containing protein